MSLTAADGVAAARNNLSLVADQLRAAQATDPDSRQLAAIAEGLRLVWQARNVLAPAAVNR